MFDSLYFLCMISFFLFYVLGIFCICGILSIFQNLRELLSGLVFTNTTQILQVRKQMECDNNEH